MTICNISLSPKAAVIAVDTLGAAGDARYSITKALYFPQLHAILASRGSAHMIGLLAQTFAAALDSPDERGIEGAVAKLRQSAHVCRDHLISAIPAAAAQQQEIYFAGWSEAAQRMKGWKTTLAYDFQPRPMPDGTLLLPGCAELDQMAGRVDPLQPAAMLEIMRVQVATARDIGAGALVGGRGVMHTLLPSGMQVVQMGDL